MLLFNSLDVFLEHAAFTEIGRTRERAGVVPVKVVDAKAAQWIPVRGIGVNMGERKKRVQPAVGQNIPDKEAVGIRYDDAVVVGLVLDQVTEEFRHPCE